MVQPFAKESFFKRKKMQPFSIGTHLRKVGESIQRRKEELKRFLREKERHQTHHKISLADACRQIQMSARSNQQTKQAETTIKKLPIQNVCNNLLNLFKCIQQYHITYNRNLNKLKKSSGIRIIQQARMLGIRIPRCLKMMSRKKLKLTKKKKKRLSF